VAIQTAITFAARQVMGVQSPNFTFLVLLVAIQADGIIR